MSFGVEFTLLCIFAAIAGVIVGMFIGNKIDKDQDPSGSFFILKYFKKVVYKPLDPMHNDSILSYTLNHKNFGE